MVVLGAGLLWDCLGHRCLFILWTLINKSRGILLMFIHNQLGIGYQMIVQIYWSWYFQIQISVITVKSTRHIGPQASHVKCSHRGTNFKLFHKHVHLTELNQRGLIVVLHLFYNWWPKKRMFIISYFGSTSMKLRCTHWNVQRWETRKDTICSVIMLNIRYKMPILFSLGQKTLEKSDKEFIAKSC